MLDTVESLSTMMARDPLGGEEYPTAAPAIVPMLDWPTDLFNAFTAEVADEFE